MSGLNVESLVGDCAVMISLRTRWRSSGRPTVSSKIQPTRGTMFAFALH
jgi:hypothetical protein